MEKLKQYISFCIKKYTPHLVNSIWSVEGGEVGLERGLQVKTILVKLQPPRIDPKYSKKIEKSNIFMLGCKQCAKNQWFSKHLSGRRHCLSIAPPLKSPFPFSLNNSATPPPRQWSVLRCYLPASLHSVICTLCTAVNCCPSESRYPSQAQGFLGQIFWWNAQSLSPNSHLFTRWEGGCGQ